MIDKAAGGLDRNWSGTPEIDRGSEEPATRGLADVPSSVEQPNKRERKVGKRHAMKSTEKAVRNNNVGLREF